MNKEEMRLMALTSRAMDYRSMSAIQKIFYHVSWKSLEMGAVIVIVVSVLTEAVSDLEQASLNVVALYVGGLFVAALLLDTFSAFMVTLASIVSYYLLYFNWLSGAWGFMPCVIGYTIFTAIALILMYVAMLRKEHNQTIFKGAIKCTLFTFSRRESGHGRAVNLPPDMAGDC